MRFPDLAVGPAPQLPLESFQRRRGRLAARLGDGAALVVATHPLTTYSNDVEHVFRPQSDFWYLTGFREPRAVLVLEGGTGTTTLFVQPRKPEAEVWTGRRVGVERAAEALGVDRAFSSDDLGATLPGLVEGREVHAVLGAGDGLAEGVKNALGGEPKDGRPPVTALRLRKDAEELRLMQKAADVGVAGMRAALAAVRPGGREYEVEAEFLRHVRRVGSTGPGYPPIVGAGANAAVLHYIANTDPIRGGDLVLVDAGCEWGYYNSDITRTVPAGDASAQALDLVDLVLEAHAAALAQVRPGRRFRDPHDAAVRTLTAGLVERGILSGDVDKLIEANAHRAFFMHGTSHFLGLDVHDVGRTKGDDGSSVLLEEGMVLTVEPGLYFNPDYAPCPEGLAGIGIRIEDDVAVTADGPLVLTKGLPTRPEDLV